ncbi:MULTISPECIES: YhcH/YjgK/YiaL family protein [unclassified Oscillibacter]|uniref:YhcH/YjgK/YiaL family protein n=1 Tax=unclassified Oscillibacter TaxID=2629304 RepID=UPI0025FB3182|nr:MULTISPECIES: YhcH/YjgK/YiaL family protein [unclassified Oscillibacter]
MLYETIETALEAVDRSSRLYQALCALQRCNAETLQKGRNEVCGDEIYINRMEYTTANPEEKIWEAHRAYYDVHCVLQGEERVQLSPLSAMTAKEEYHPEGDYQFFDGPAQQEVFLKPGAILICEPEDVHKVGIAADAPETIQKMVMKVQISD